MAQHDDEIPVISLASDEEPESTPHVIVLQSLSGAYRVLLGTSDGVETGKASEQDVGPDSRDAAIGQARELARAHGLAAVYLRVDA